MKKFSLFAFAAAGMLLGACSSSDDIAQQVVNPENFEDGAYIGISLTLPSADNATRANDELSNGIEAEFAVKNATLYIFKGANEASATFVDYVALGVKYDQDDQPGIDPDVWGVQDPEIETKITSTSLNEATKIDNDLAKAIKADTQNNYYAYVIINHNGQVPTLNENTTFADFSKVEFTEIGADIAAEQNIYESGMLMTNAPICDNPGGENAPVAAAKYSTLVPFDKSKIFGNAAQAKKEPAACIYVERAAVKITVEEGENLGTPTIDDYTLSVEGWQVINNERTYYNTRQINFDGTAAQDWGPFFNNGTAKASAKYRFVSLYRFEPTLPTGLTPQEGQDIYQHTVGYRTYFASDPHYNVNATAAAVTADGPSAASTLDNTVASDARPWIVAGKHAYTTENTFDVAHQTWRNTTMVTIKAQLKKADGTAAAGFYTVGDGSQTMYDKVSDVEAALKNTILNDANVANKIQTALTTISTTEGNANKKCECILTVTLTEATKATTGVPFTYTYKWTVAGADYNYNDNNEVKNAIDAFVKKDGVYTAPVLVSYYENGITYYNVRIKHFGDAETPWAADASYVTGGGTTTEEIYGTDAATATSNFLGRYGVVRDNWYKLSIDAITKIGSATPIDPSLTNPDTPDDEIENFISVHVHIVPWVLRSQSVQL